MPFWYGDGMTLEQYFAKNDKLSHEEFGKLIGASQPTVSRYVNGTRTPSREMIKKIQDATKGKVSFADWFSKEQASA